MGNPYDYYAYENGKADGAAQERREIIDMLRTPLAKAPFYLNPGLAEAIAIIEQRSQEESP